MKVLKLIITIFFILSISIMAVAKEGAKVTSIIGKVEYKAGNADWKPIFNGLEISKNMELRVDQKAAVELEIGKNKVKLSKKGTYSMDKILISANLKNSVESKHKVTSVAGARADENINKHNDPLMLDDVVATGDAIASANFFINKNDYVGAIKSLDDKRIDKLSADKKDDAYRLLGYCHFENGNMEEAIKAFDKVSTLNPDNDTLGKSLIYSALALNNLGEYEKSIEKAEAVLNNKDLKAIWNEANSICASNYIMLGNEEKAESYIKKIKE